MFIHKKHKCVNLAEGRSWWHIHTLSSCHIQSFVVYLVHFTLVSEQFASRNSQHVAPASDCCPFNCVWLCLVWFICRTLDCVWGFQASASTGTTRHCCATVILTAFYKIYLVTIGFQGKTKLCMSLLVAWYWALNDQISHLLPVTKPHSWNEQITCTRSGWSLRARMDFRKCLVTDSVAQITPKLDVWRWVSLMKFSQLKQSSRSNTKSSAPR